MQRLKSLAIDLADLAVEGAHELASQLANSDQTVESVFVAKQEHGVYVTAYYIETSDESEKSFSVVRCENVAGSEMWFELERL